MKIKAAVLRAIDQPFQIEELELAPPKENEVLVRTVASGICHSDYSVAHGILRAPLPVVLGHEGAGIVEAVGPGVSHVKPGDKVIASLSPSCGKCSMCRESKEYMCSQMNKLLTDCTQLDGTTRHRTLSGEDVYALCGVGSFGEYMVMPAGSAIKVPDDTPLDKTCLIGCGVTTGAGAALNTAKVQWGESVAIIGCGGVGLSILQGARIAGASIIIAIDPMQEKRDLATKLGATHTINPFEEDPIARVKEITGGLGVHYAFEALGKVQTMQQTWGMIRPTGKAIIVGVASLDQSVKIPAAGLLAEYEIQGSCYGSSTPKRDIPRFVDLYKRGQLKLDEMITQRIGLADINRAFEEMGRGEGARSVIIYG
ncbi:MAG: Zn-dependent alcohol dehydrogenase [Pseudomonadota bacterium]